MPTLSTQGDRGSDLLGDLAPGVSQALSQLRTAGLITTARAGHTHRYQAALNRDDYLTSLIAAALDHADDPAAMLRAALHTAPAMTNHLLRT
ncbi:MAG TPA: hypothetical protein VFI65_19465 [Streptosporangiaceae bacterium]|nr:hypothetical protein [Streptosporangiaceae bacterium]